MKSDNFVLTLAVFLFFISVVSLSFTYFSGYNFKSNLLTGFSVTTNGTIYINITSAESFNLSTNVINWGNGRVNSSTVQAMLSTAHTGSNAIQNGTWNTVTTGFRLENNGNVNLSINVMSGSNATSFIGGTNPAYKYNVSNVEAGACVAGTGFTLNVFNDVNNTYPGTRVCSNLSYYDSLDFIKIDVMLLIPYNSRTGNLTDQFQFTGTQSAS